MPFRTNYKKKFGLSGSHEAILGEFSHCWWIFQSLSISAALFNKSL